MGNLEYCDARTRAAVEAVLKSEGIHEEAKRIIRTGLNRDCLDAAVDAMDAARCLEDVRKSIMGK